MRYLTTVTVNGTRCEQEVEARLLLVQYLRDILGLTGTHVGCDTGQCGACTVLLDGQAIKSCTVLAVQTNGKEVLTIEGLARGGDLHPLQRAFSEEHGLQCGFCTPGMIMVACQLLKLKTSPTNSEIRIGLIGNLCRCTGYHNIVKAIHRGAQLMKELG
jgi:carbon-monoxide dehydrogenase small subunit